MNKLAIKLACIIVGVSAGITAARAVCVGQKCVNGADCMPKGCTGSGFNVTSADPAKRCVEDKENRNATCNDNGEEKDCKSTGTWHQSADCSDPSNIVKSVTSKYKECTT